jgi:hypothetical protein
MPAPQRRYGGGPRVQDRYSCRVGCRCICGRERSFRCRHRCKGYGHRPGSCLPDHLPHGKPDHSGQQLAKSEAQEHMAGKILTPVPRGTERSTGRQAGPGNGHQGPDGTNNCTHVFDLLPLLLQFNQQAYY